MLYEGGITTANSSICLSVSLYPAETSKYFARNSNRLIGQSNNLLICPD